MSVYHPKWRPVTIDVSSADQSFNPPLERLLISEAGVVEFDSDDGETYSVDLPAAVTDETVTAVPFVLECLITRIDQGNTTVPSAHLLGFRRV